MRGKRAQTDLKIIQKRRLGLISVFSTAVIMIMLFSLLDLIEDIRTDASAYEILYEADETFPQEGKTYTLYVDGELRGDIDQNRYCLIDENGNTDYKFCALMEDASRFTYILILCLMLYLVLLIAKNSLEMTPFTRKNIRIIKAIALLQLFLGILPGVVRSVMSQLRFDYSSTTLDEKWFFMVVTSFVIGSIAYIFEKGLDLQDDVDSIV